MSLLELSYGYFLSVLLLLALMALRALGERGIADLDYPRIKQLGQTMRLAGLGLLASILLIGPAWADNWSSYYNMATFGAGGGADEGGWFNLECADEESGFSMAGEPFFDVIIGEKFHQKKAALEPMITFVVDDGRSYLLPMNLEQNSTTHLHYDRNPETFPEMQDFIAALRRGNQVTAWSGAQQLASVTLDGSFAALEFVEACVAGED